MTQSNVAAECFCDGNGSMPCWSCGGQGQLLTCPDDLCQGAGECMHGDGEDPCDICDGTGELVCGAHE